MSYVLNYLFQQNTAGMNEELKNLKNLYENLSKMLADLQKSSFDATHDNTLSSSASGKY